MIVRRDLVSIVIPCYNYGRFLGEAIESALQQTYQPIEIVVVDDGSTDQTFAVASQYPVRILSQRNRGVCAAINAGVEASRGVFVMRLDADDKLAPAYVEETLAALQIDPLAHFAYTEVSYFGARSGTYPAEEFDPETLAERNYVHGSALMRRSSFDVAGGYDPRLAAARCEDWDLWLSFAERGLKGVRVPKPLLLYRQHPVASRNALQWNSVSVLRRNLALAAHVQDAHPTLFDTDALLRRLLRLPHRFLAGQAAARFCALLVTFYGVMLIRDVLGFRGGRDQPCAA